jgi:hypothetical protein
MQSTEHATGTLQRRHSMAERQSAVTHKHVAALSALKVYPQHLPLDGQCLDDLVDMGLVRPVKDGYRLTPRGEESLQTEVLRLRQHRA